MVDVERYKDDENDHDHDHDHDHHHMCCKFEVDDK